MTDLPIWAQDRAREWVKSCWGTTGAVRCKNMDSLATLLVEVAAVGEMVRAEDAEYLSTLRADVLAEVRRVVLMVKAETDRPGLCDEILARIEEL